VAATFMPWVVPVMVPCLKRAPVSSVNCPSKELTAGPTDPDSFVVVNSPVPLGTWSCCDRRALRARPP
jgi:hypothetical protein